MNPEQWLSLKWNGGSTMSDRWLNQSKIIQNIPYSSGRSKIFEEYDKDGNLIKSFRYDALQFSYRVLKYNFKGFYFR